MSITTEAPGVRSVALELTTRCNQRCRYCYNAWRDQEQQPHRELSLERLDNILDRLLDEVELEQITLTGGEPLLHPRLHDIIERINRRDLGVSLISNGGLATAEVARRLAEQQVHGVQLTLAGGDAAEHDAVCGDGSFERVLRGIDRLSTAGVWVSGSLLVTAQSARGAGRVLRQFISLGVRGVAFNRFNPSGFALAAAQDLLPTRSQVIEALEAAEALADPEGGQDGLQLTCTMPIPACMVDEEKYPHVAFGSCSAGTLYGEPAVSPDGMLSLCTLQRHPVGDLLQEGLSALLESPAAQAFRAAVPEFCRGCLYEQSCLGGCGAAAQWAFGSASALDPFVAQHVLADYAERIGRPADHLPHPSAGPTGSDGQR